MKPKLPSTSLLKMTSTIRWKILTLVGVGATVLFLAVFFTSQFGLPFGLHEGRYQRRELEAMNRLNFIADSEKTLISIWINERLADLRFNSQTPHFQSHLIELAAAERQERNVRAILAELALWFQLAKKNYHYEAVDLVDSETGISLFSSQEEQSGKKSLLFDKLFAAGPDWEEKVLFVHNIDNSSSICLAYQLHIPIAKGSAETDGFVILYRIRTAQFLDEVIRYSDVLGQSGEIALIDHNQTLLTPLKYPLADGTVAGLLEYRLVTESAELASRGIEGVQKTLDYRGVPVAAATRSFRAPALILGIIVKQDEAEIFSSLKKSTLYTTSITVTGLVFLLTLLYFVTRRLLKPLEKLSSVVKRIKQGDLSARAEVSGSDKTGLLSAAFNEMVDEIQRWHRGLEVAVQGRTAELRKFSEVVEQSPVSIVITDVMGNIEFINPKFIEMTGYGVEDVLGQNPRILKSAETPPATYKELWETISSGHTWDGDLANRKKNGDIFWEHVQISPIKNSDGVITGYVGIKEDITERRLLEAQLLQSQKMEALGTLAGGIAHDFNNILTVISGYGTILKMKLVKDAPSLAMVEEILAAEGRAEVMTRSLLAFSRKEEIRLSLVNLDDIIRGLEKSLTRLIREDIEFKIELTDRNLPIMADKGQIEQLIINLVVNARDAMPSGGALALNIVGKSPGDKDAPGDDLPPQGRYTVITVADTGTGMDKQTRERIFDPFFTTKETGKGTGLGLSMAYSIVKKHGGSIYVWSEPGEGTTFKIYLPLLEQPQECCKTDSTQQFMSGSETILLVEDDAPIRKIVTTCLTEQGYTVLAAENGAEGVELFSRNRDIIDLILTDVIMPKKNGKEMYQEISRIRADMPVIFMSGYTADVMNDDQMSSFNLMLKPINPVTLLAKIREVLAGEKI